MTTGSHSCLKAKPKQIDEIPRCLRELVVKEPHQFLYVGTFLPVRKMPRLEIFTKEEFEDQLCRVMQINTEQHI